MIQSAFVLDIPLAIVRRYTQMLKYTNKNLNKIGRDIYRAPPPPTPATARAKDDLPLFLAAFPHILDLTIETSHKIIKIH